MRKLENVKTKIIKLPEETKFIKMCKQENLIPTFSNVKLAIKTGNTKLKKEIARLISEMELQNKHFEKTKAKEKLQRN